VQFSDFINPNGRHLHKKARPGNTRAGHLEVHSKRVQPKYSFSQAADRSTHSLSMMTVYVPLIKIDVPPAIIPFK
jgi:hypothetical protein